jgi:L-cysteine:1D-myo-inositol 2-amino-2-deoxy-alpha-D-glucopyranoside ligase
VAFLVFHAARLTFEEMALRLYNTLTRTIEEFTSSKIVNMYVCGVTPYDTTHLGHARTYIVFDVLVRLLMKHRLHVNYIQNITDVDDSILKRARELDEPYDVLGDLYTSRYLEDVAALGLIPASVYPKATDSIEEMKEVIARLLDRGHAYAVDGDVYFDISTWPAYGRLGGLSRAAMLEIEVAQDGSTVDDPRKRDPLDFLLWRSESPGEPSWASPWGAGRPGWHIECSTIAMKHLGRQLDIHGGGDDLVFPHHECEIAQSEAVTGVAPFARFWMHVAMARLAGAKMSKSEGNMVFVRDLLEHHSADAFRIYVLGTHYRTPLDYVEEGLLQAGELALTLATAARLPVESGTRSVSPEEHLLRFDDALDADLDTPSALRAVGELADVVMKGFEAGDGIREARRAIRSCASRLGLQLEVKTPR